MEKLYNLSGDIQTETKHVYPYKIHMHTYYEMIFYEPFEGNIAINGKKISIDTPSAVLICPSDFHEICVTDAKDAKYIKIGFNADVLTGIFPDYSCILTNITNQYTISTFEEIIKSSQDKQYAKILINSLVYTITKSGEKLLSALGNNLKSYKIVSNAAKIINENSTTDITLECVANDLSISPQYLSYIFKQNLGINFSEYLTNIRLDNAAKLITETDKSITEICFEVGYRNFSHFSRSFKKKFGISPSLFSKN